MASGVTPFQQLQLASGSISALAAIDMTRCVPTWAKQVQSLLDSELQAEEKRLVQWTTFLMQHTMGCYAEYYKLASLMYALEPDLALDQEEKIVVETCEIAMKNVNVPLKMLLKEMHGRGLPIQSEPGFFERCFRHTSGM